MIEETVTSTNLVAEELAKAGTDPALLAKLRRDAITVDTVLPPMEFLVRLFGIPCCPRGELVAFTGKAKSGKTFVMSMLMAVAAMPDVLAFSRNTVEPLSMLWVDTEQSAESTLDILKNRIVPMVCEPQDGSGQPMPFPKGLYDIINVRMEDWQDRLPLLMSAIDLYRPDLVLLDGVRDLVDDINDGPQAHRLAEKLLRIAQIRHCCIVTVIHQNKAAEDKTLRGSLGSELTNKAFDVFECEKLMPSRTFALTQKLTRKNDIEPVLYYTVDERGLPRQVGAPAADGGARATARTEPLHDLRSIFTSAFGSQAELGGDDLRSRVMAALCMDSFKAYGNLLRRAIADGILRQWKRGGHVYYSLQGPA